MTKQHFERLAKTVKEMSEASDKGKVTVTRVAFALADFCASQNPRFDRQRFLDACGL